MNDNSDGSNSLSNEFENAATETVAETNTIDESERIAIETESELNRVGELERIATENNVQPNLTNEFERAATVNEADPNLTNEFDRTTIETEAELNRVDELEQELERLINQQGRLEPKYIMTPDQEFSQDVDKEIFDSNARQIKVVQKQLYYEREKILQEPEKPSYDIDPSESD